jgi:hypothetical protein
MSNSSTDRRVPPELFPAQPALRLYDCVVEALRSTHGHRPKREDFEYAKSE